MDWGNIITELVIWLVSSGMLVMGARWLAKRVGWNTGRDVALDAIDAIGNRAVDKYKAEYERELEAARDPNSDGGTTITEAEREKAASRAREQAYGALMGGLKGEALDFAKEQGPEIIKGMIGRVMSKREKAA